MSHSRIEASPFYPTIDIGDETATAVLQKLRQADLYALHEVETSLLHGIGHTSIALTVQNYLEEINSLYGSDHGSIFSEGFGAYEVVASLVKSPHATTKASLVRESQAFIRQLSTGEVLSVLSDAVGAADHSNTRTMKLLGEAARLYDIPHENYFLAGASVALQIDAAARFPDL